MQWVSQNASPLLRFLKLNVKKKKNKLSIVTQLICQFYYKEGSTHTTAGLSTSFPAHQQKGRFSSSIFQHKTSPQALKPHPGYLPIASDKVKTRKVVLISNRSHIHRLSLTWPPMTEKRRGGLMRGKAEGVLRQGLGHGGAGRELWLGSVTSSWLLVIFLWQVGVNWEVYAVLLSPLSAKQESIPRMANQE